MKFTIGIPAYKAKFLTECIDSILAQTYTDFELIIVNDASPENVDGIVKNYDDKRIRYYRNEKNFGAENVVDNWSKCLSFAKGEYFVLMGDDDKMEPNYLEEFTNLICKYPNLGIYHCRTKIIDEKSEFITLTEARAEYESVYSMIWHRMNGALQYISDFVYHTETLITNGGFYKMPLAWGSDLISAYIASIHKGIANTNKPVLNYRRSSSTISSTGSIDLKMKALLLGKKWISDYIADNNPQTEEDRMLANMIEKRLSMYFVKQQIYTLCSYMQKTGVMRGFLWFMKSKSKLSFSFSGFLYCCIEYIKCKKINA